MDYTSIKVGQLPTDEISGGNFIPHEVAGVLKKATFTDLAAFIGASGAIGFKAVSVSSGDTLPATETQEFILVGAGTYNNVGGGSPITVTEQLNALVSNGTYWFIGVEIPIEAPPGNAIWGQIIGTLSNQTDLQNLFNLKSDLVDGKVPSSQLPSYVDDVVEVANYAALPASGETGKIYITIDTEYIYRWSGSVYVRIADEAAAWGTITGTLSNQIDLQNALNAKEDDIAAGTTAQYWRGDKSWQTLNKTAVGLNNVDNTSDLNKPISTATQTALDGKFDDPTGDTTQYIAGDGSLISFPIAGQSGTLVREVRNATGATLTKGTVVYINGASGNKPTVTKALATGDSTSAQTFGLVQSDISNNANGYVVCIGDLIGVNTSGISVGTQLYLSSSVAGEYTTTKQTAPAHLVYVGVVTRSHATLGQIEVKIQNGYELDEIHDVAISSVVNNQVLVYESATGLWKNKTIGTILGGSSSQFTKGDGSLDSNTYATTSQLHNAVTIGTANGLSLSTQVLSLGLASTSANGALSSTDWNTFNGKQPALSGTGFVKISGSTISYDNSTYLTSITSGNVTTALGYTPYNATNPNGYITGITSGNVTTALGYTPYNATNPNGYTSNTGTVTSVSGTGTVSGLTLTGSITGSGSLTLGGTLSLTSGNVTSALGFTPYNASNPSGYISSYTETDTLSSVVSRGATTGGGRPISIDTSGGGISIKGSAGGWATGYYFNGSSGTYRGGFGALGDTDGLSNYWIGAAYNNYYAYIDSSQLTHTSSSRAPIFYDSDNTGYYLNPASTSNLSSLNLTGQQNFTTQGAKVYFGDNSVGNPLCIGEGLIDTLGVDSDFMTLYGRNSIRFFTNGTVEKGRFDTDGFKASIIYDLDNTGYYLNPASTSNLNYIAGNRIYAGSDAGVDGSISTNNWFRTVGACGWYSQTYSGGIYMNDTTWVRIYGSKAFYVENTIYSTSDVKAPIFYDANDTGYYINPASDSKLQNLSLVRSGASSDPYGVLSVSCPSGDNYSYIGLTRNGIVGMAMGIDTSSNFWIGSSGGGHNSVRTSTYITISTGGTFTATGDVIAYSDGRVKENIETIDNALNKVLSLRGVTYNRTDKEDKSQKIGVIAQEIQEVLPQVVQEQEDGMLGVSYGNITAVLIEAIKEQQKQIEELKQLIKN